MIWQSLKAKRNGKVLELSLIESQIKLLHDEIELRKRLIDQLLEKYKLIQGEAQNLADELLEMEYNNLIKQNI